MKSLAVSNVLLLIVGLAMGLKHPYCATHPYLIDRGHCKPYSPSFSYNSDSNQCQRWIWGGCGPRTNIFTTQQSCEWRCKE